MATYAQIMSKDTAKNTAVKEEVKKFIADHENTPHEEGKVLSIILGEAPAALDPIKPNKVHLSGTIKAPSEFYNKRKHLHNKDACHVLYDVLGGSIIVVVNEMFASDNHQITGKLSANPELAQFKINTGTTFGPKDLQNVLKFNRVLFFNQDENAKICLALQNFKAKISTDITDVDDQRGDAERGVKIKIDHEIAESFTLKMPLFKGQPEETFKVDVWVEARSGGVSVWLESRELKELQQKRSKEIVEKELENFKDVVCIEQ